MFAGSIRTLRQARGILRSPALTSLRHARSCLPGRGVEAIGQ